MNQTFVQPKLPFLVCYSCWFPILVTLLFPLETSEWREIQAACFISSTFHSSRPRRRKQISFGKIIFSSALLKLYGAYRSPGDLVNLQILGQGLRFCLSFSFFPFFFLVEPAACGSSLARDQTHTTAATWATAVTMPHAGSLTHCTTRELQDFVFPKSFQVIPVLLAHRPYLEEQNPSLLHHLYIRTITNTNSKVLPHDPHAWPTYDRPTHRGVRAART